MSGLVRPGALRALPPPPREGRSALHHGILRAALALFLCFAALRSLVARHGTARHGTAATPDGDWRKARRPAGPERRRGGPALCRWIGLSRWNKQGRAAEGTPARPPFCRPSAAAVPIPSWEEGMPAAAAAAADVGSGRFPGFLGHWGKA